MGYLKYENENIFLDGVNKIILTEYKQFYRFMKNIKGIENGSIKVEYNNLNLTNKNTLIIDLSNVSSLVEIFSNNNRIIEEYLKVKLEKLIFMQEDEEKLNNIIKQYLTEMFGKNQELNVEIDYLKLLKSNSNISIKNEDDFLNMIYSILTDSNNIKQMIIIYKKSLLKAFKLQEVEYIQSDKVCLFEICDKESQIDINDNILVFDKEITQIRVDDFFDLIIDKNKTFNRESKETYSFLIAKILFYSINRKEVDLMKKYSKEISELVEILDGEFKINLEDTLGYI